MASNSGSSLGGFVQSVAALAHVPVWVAWVVLIGMGVVFVVRVASAARNGRLPARDPKRAFTDAERMRAFRRAGNRCEHKPLLWFRCSAAPTTGDHIYPHSKGGATVLSNCQALCFRHNSRKSDRVPSRWEIARLERRRRSYFPVGEPVRVGWRKR